MTQIFVFGVFGILGYLIVDGILTGSVWVRGGGEGKLFSNQWAHKRSRTADPGWYFGAMGFYGAGIIVLLYLTLFT